MKPAGKKGRGQHVLPLEKGRMEGGGTLTHETIEVPGGTALGEEGETLEINPGRHEEGAHRKRLATETVDKADTTKMGVDSKEGSTKKVFLQKRRRNSNDDPQCKGP